MFSIAEKRGKVKFWGEKFEEGKGGSVFYPGVGSSVLLRALFFSFGCRKF